MSEQDNSPEISANSPKSPSTPEKRFSLSKLIENIVLLIAGVAFTISLFSKNKNTETKESHKDNQKEIKESHEKTEQSQEGKNKEIKSPISKSRITNRLGDLRSSASRKICLKLRKKITKDKFKDVLKKLGIAMGASSMVFIASWITTSHWRDILNGAYPIFKYLFSDNIPLGISISLAVIVAFSMLFAKGIVTCSQKGISSLTNRYFMFTLAGLAILGASSALLIPSYTDWFRGPEVNSTQQDDIKDNKEKLKESPSPTPSPTVNKAAEVEQKSTSDLRLHLLYITGGIIAILGLIETNRKNSQDHIRQVHAARRDRYIEAVDKLSSKSAPVRLGGVYALVGLADEWLDDDNIDKETRLKEGQVIVNNLCSYIRSPFILAEKREIIEAATSPYVYSGNLNKDKARLREEQEVRRTIFTEMSKRGSTFTKNEEGDMIPSLGEWSEFEFDFSHAPIFYPLREVKFTNANFNNAKFYGHTDLSHSQFYGEANIQHVDFCGSTLFDYIYFHNGLNLSFSHFHMKAGITSSVVREKGIFCETHFHKEAFFSDTDFLPEGSANFSFTKFHQRTVFNNTNFYGEAMFSADFMSSTTFEGAYFEVEPNFEYSYFSDKEEHNFETRESSPYHIKTKVENYKGKRIKLPIGADIYTSNVEKNLPSNNSKNSSEP